MTEGNGKIMSLEAARSQKARKGNDFITVQQAYDMVIQECAKVHEHYLTQIPQHVAQMTQDALREFKLIKVVATEDGQLILVPHMDPREAVALPVAAVSNAPAVSENAGGDTPPADTTAPVAAESPDNLKVVEDPAVQVSGDAESTPAPVAQS